MTVEQQSGRALVILSLAVFVVVSVAIMIWDASVYGAPMLYVHIPKLGLIVLLFVWLLRGSRIARWGVVALLAAGGVIGMYSLFAGLPGATGAALLGLLYLVLAGMLATSSSLSSFLELQQRSRAQAARS